MDAGKAFVATIGIVVVLGAVVAIAYTLQGRTELSMTFERVAAPPENVTAYALSYKPVHSAYFLEDHLDTAVLRGASNETETLRVETMRDTLRQLTGQPGPEWWVTWQGTTVRIVLAEA